MCYAFLCTCATHDSARTLYIVSCAAQPFLCCHATFLPTGALRDNTEHGCVTQRQNKCACSLRVSNLTRRNGGVFKIPIVCFRFPGISPNQNRLGCRFQERFLRTSSITYLIQQKKNIVVAGVNLAIEVEHS